jgi:hypothetical protein
MSVIRKKIWPEYFEDVKSGKKTFEFRVADFDVKEGDTLILEEFDSRTKTYTGRTMEKKISHYIHIKPEDFNKFGGISKNGFYVISLKG